ncbi:helix-turn-helix transcriptional regulator [Aestuariicoccus sp. MJ-SS9]|uniref:helix-turn-helix transcriptional regulator n=1 Tax=Aestuariicoccus sp. MJ-SS9 TaxID=3079855 RepID=UPI002910E6EF|nr:helix-turn-helix transcriptional regulator [Aestuariicoccus sp. MJ-SS9]MDU8912687.1 helix-turn-helix transcriptional regulator [Aestuariicoccus sp. MJ-SS9]
MSPAATEAKPLALLVLIAAQSFCAAFFLWDVAADGGALGWAALRSAHFLIELLAALALVAAVIFETRYLLRLLRRKAHLEEQLGLAAGAFHDIVTDRFQRWGLTPSEQDVAMFLLKGFGIPEIAQLRGSAEGTVKAHLNGIYRKADVTGRGAFVSLFIEDLMSGLPQDRG